MEEEKFADLNLVVSHDSDSFIDDWNIMEIEVVVTLVDGSKIHKKVHDWSYEEASA